MRIRTFLKISLICLACFLLAELGALFFLNNYYLVDRSSFSAAGTSPQTSASPQNAVPAKIKYQVAIPSAAESLQYSSDAAYVCYLLDNRIYVVTMSDGGTLTVLPESGGTVSSCKFVRSRDRLIITEKNSAKTSLKLYYYDIAAKDKSPVYNKYTNSAVRIDLDSSSEEVTDIQTSPLTNMIYLKLTGRGGRSRVCCLDVMSQYSRVYLPYTHIGTINLVYGDDILYCENQDNSRIYSKNSRLTLKTSAEKDTDTDFKIIGSDSDNRLYIAQVKGGMTDTVFFGDSKSGWIKTSLGKSVGVRDVLLDFKGRLYLNDEEQGILKNLTTGESVSYGGSVLGITDSGVFLLQNNHLGFEAF